MRKSTLKRLLLVAPGSLLVLFFTLSLFGRQVGPKPLPWHVAWLAPFGSWGERFSCEWAIYHAETKQEFIEIWGEPVFVMIGDVNNVRKGSEIDLYEKRADECWLFEASPDQLSGRAIRFSNNRVIER